MTLACLVLGVRGTGLRFQIPGFHRKTYLDLSIFWSDIVKANSTVRGYVNGRNAVQRGFIPPKNLSTGWCKVPPAVPFSPAVPASTRVSARMNPLMGTPRFTRECSPCDEPATDPTWSTEGREHRAWGGHVVSLVPTPLLCECGKSGRDDSTMQLTAAARVLSLTSTITEYSLAHSQDVQSPDFRPEAQFRRKCKLRTIHATQASIIPAIIPAKSPIPEAYHKLQKVHGTDR